MPTQRLNTHQITFPPPLKLLCVSAVLAGALALVPISASCAPPATTGSDLFTSNFDGIKLVDQDDQVLAMSTLHGRVVLFNFVFTRCSAVCPVQTQTLAQVLERLPASARARTRFVSVSVDPLSDTPATLKAYARRMGAELPGWSFATGRPQDIDRLAHRLRLFRQDRLGASPKPEDHAAALWLVDANGLLRMRYDNRALNAQRLSQDINTLVSLAPTPPTKP